jgi:hypothetical protein
VQRVNTDTAAPWWSRWCRVATGCQDRQRIPGLRAVLPGTRVRPSLSPDRRSRFCATAWAHAVRIHRFETPGNLLGRAPLGQMRPHVLPQSGVQSARGRWLRDTTISPIESCAFLCIPPTIRYPARLPMPFVLRPYRLPCALRRHVQHGMLLSLPLACLRARTQFRMSH